MLMFSGFFAMAEAALLSISRFKVRHWVEKRKLGASHLKRLHDNPEMLLSTLLIGNNLVNTAAAVIATSIAIGLFGDNAIGIATGIVTFLILIFGDLTPKSIGRNNNESIAPVIAPIVWNMSLALYPIIKLMEYFLHAIHRLIGTKKNPLLTKEELRSILKTSEEEGSIKEVEKRLIQRIFDFENTSVSDVMTGKKQMVLVSADMKIKDVLGLPLAKMYSRFPVYEKQKDNIVGILYIKDTLKQIKENKTDIEVRHIMRNPLFVFTNKKLDSTLRLFQSRKQHMAVVINEKVEVMGLITIENILEEIVGEIIDESDKINPNIIQVSKNEWLLRGSTEAEEVSQKTGMQISSDFANLDGFVLSTFLGRSPKTNEQILHQNFRIVIEEVQGKKILRARIIKIDI